MLEKVVHLDLKGAAPLPPSKSTFWERFCSFVKNLGVDSLLLEWEDSVPLKLLECEAGVEESDDDSTRFCYSRHEALNVVQTAEHAGLNVIPLVQVFGHLEYVLKKKKYAHLREIPEFPDCLAAVRRPEDEGARLIADLVEQVVSFTPNCPAIHLGSDEVWHLGCGVESRRRLAGGLTMADLFFDHVNVVVDMVREKYPKKRLLLWDDMLRRLDIQTLTRKPSETLKNEAEWCVWQYQPSPHLNLPPDLFERYSVAFRKPPWIATAFKGATSSCAQVPVLGHHVANHLDWVRHIEDRGISTAGFILTGWQRFDHFAGLCELLPVALPSLYCCLHALKEKRFEDTDRVECFRVLGLKITGLPQEDSVKLPKFPGSDVFVGMERFFLAQVSVQDFLNGQIVRTWLSDYLLSKGRVSCLRIRGLRSSALALLSELEAVEKHLNMGLAEIYPQITVLEWMETQMKPLKQQLIDILDKTRRCDDQTQ